MTIRLSPFSRGIHASSQAFGPQAAVQDLHIAPYKLDDAHPGCAALLHWLLLLLHTKDQSSKIVQLSGPHLVLHGSGVK